MIMNSERTIFEELGFDLKQVQLPDGAVLYSLARTYGLVMRRLSEIYHRFGLSPAGFNLLVLLQRGKDPSTFTQRAIGDRLVVSPSDMSGLIDRMERRGLVKRTPGADRRSKLLRITPKGSALVDDVWPHHAEAISQMAKGLEAADVQAMLRVLARVRGAMGV